MQGMPLKQRATIDVDRWTIRESGRAAAWPDPGGTPPYDRMGAVSSRREILQFRIPKLDRNENDCVRLRLAVSLLSDLLASRVPTRVCCSAGANRAAAVAPVAIAQIHGQTPGEAREFIREHPPTDISSGLWNKLLRTGSLPAPCRDPQSRCTSRMVETLIAAGSRIGAHATLTSATGEMN